MEIWTSLISQSPSRWTRKLRQAKWRGGHGPTCCLEFRRWTRRRRTCSSLWNNSNKMEMDGKSLYCSRIADWRLLFPSPTPDLFQNSAFLRLHISIAFLRATWSFLADPPYKKIHDITTIILSPLAKITEIICMSRVVTCKRGPESTMRIWSANKTDGHVLHQKTIW